VDMADNFIANCSSVFPVCECSVAVVCKNDLILFHSRAQLTNQDFLKHGSSFVQLRSTMYTTGGTNTGNNVIR